MNYRRIGKTGLSVSEVGYCAWGIGKSGWIGASDDESLKALHRAIDLGLNFIDTALGYGDGHLAAFEGQCPITVQFYFVDPRTGSAIIGSC